MGFFSKVCSKTHDGYAYNKKGLKSHKEYKDAFKKLAGW